MELLCIAEPNSSHLEVFSCACLQKMAIGELLDCLYTFREGWGVSWDPHVNVQLLPTTWCVKLCLNCVGRGEAGYVSWGRLEKE